MKGLALGVMLSVCAALPAAAQTGPDAIQATYEAQVQSSFGTTFTECFRFNVPTPKDLLIDGFGTPLLFRFGDLNTDHSRWQAITESGSGAAFAIMFHGKFGTFGRFKGEALNEFGDSFVLSGRRNDACPDSARAKGGNWHK